jgi:hypothetical protein
MVPRGDDLIWRIGSLNTEAILKAKAAEAVFEAAAFSSGDFTWIDDCALLPLYRYRSEDAFANKGREVRRIVASTNWATSHPARCDHAEFRIIERDATGKHTAIIEHKRRNGGDVRRPTPTISRRRQDFGFKPSQRGCGRKEIPAFSLTGSGHTSRLERAAITVLNCCRPISDTNCGGGGSAMTHASIAGRIPVDGAHTLRAGAGVTNDHALAQDARAQAAGRGTAPQARAARPASKAAWSTTSSGQFEDWRNGGRCAEWPNVSSRRLGYTLNWIAFARCVAAPLYQPTMEVGGAREPQALRTS